MAFSDPPALPDWLSAELPFRRRMARLAPYDLHFVDHGEGRPALLVHGNPTWSWIWRKVIHALDGRVRAIAPDLLGFGLSSKPRRPSAHDLRVHAEVLTRLVVALDLRDVVLVGQDWGGPIAMAVGRRVPDRVGGIVLGNTAVVAPRRPLRVKAFHRLSHVPWVSDLLFRGLGFPLRHLHRVQGDPRSLDGAAYRWPLRRLADRAGPLGLARMVPDREGHPSLPELEATADWLSRWRGPVGLVWGTRDPILGGGLRRHAALFPQAELRETTAGHFSQEEVPDAWAELVAGMSSKR